MTEKYKKFKSVVIIILSASFTFLSFLAEVSIAKEVLDTGNSYPVIKGKIDTTEQKLSEERLKMRLKEAKEYMEKGDRYYAAGKLQEALGEWYSALALLDLLQGMGIQAPIDSCVRLENEIKSRIDSEENKADPRRQAQIEKRVKEVLSQRIKEDQAAEKKQIVLLKGQPEEKPAVPAAKSHESVSLQELEVMKQDRQAVEEMISRDLVKGKDNALPQTKVQALKEEDRLSQQATESKVAKVAKELASEDKKAQVIKAAKNENLDLQRAEEQKRLESKQILAQEEAARLKEAQLARQNDEFKSAAEGAILKERLEAKNEAAKLKQSVEKNQKEILARESEKAKAQEQLKKQAEDRIQAQLAQESKESQELKAKTEKLESDKLKALAKEKDKLNQVENQLQAAEKKAEIKQAKKRIAKKEKQRAKKPSMEKASQPSAPTGGVDKFDLIDKVLTSYDSYQDNNYRRD